MNIARPLVERFHEQFVHQPDDRRRLGRFGKFAQFGRNLIEELDAFFLLLRDELRDRVAANAEALLDELHDLVLAGQDGIKSDIGQRAEFIEGFEIKRVARRDSHVAVHAFQRQHPMPKHRRRREQRQRRRIGLGPLERHEPHVQLFRERLQHGFFADDALRHEHLVDPPAGAFQPRSGNLVLRGQAAIEKEGRNIHD